MKFRIVTALGVLLPVFVAHAVAGENPSWPLRFAVAFVAFGLGRIVDRCMNGTPERAGLGWLIFAGSMLSSFAYAFAIVRAAGGELP